MVVYVVGYDLGASEEEQNKQIAFWLDFLNSSSPIRKDVRPRESTNWRIILAGLQADLLGNKFATVLDTPVAWQQRWQHLPLFDKRFQVSSKSSPKSVKLLLSEIENECNRIFISHTTRIPTAYNIIWDRITQHAAGKVTATFRQDMLIKECSNGVSKEVFTSALQYLHAIGRIVLTPSGLVFTDPTKIPQIAAKFVSPKEVRGLLLKKEGVEILEQKEVGILLCIDTNHSQQ